ncbi:hypothetical protein N9023_06745, partial [Opitutaceae bacterium]|nr:hypothetical protein [Opitutaceae bacterium]
AGAAIRPASLFQDHMVLQRDLPVPVWGKATPGVSVVVTFENQTKTAEADSTGKWRVTLDPLKGSAKPANLTVGSNNNDASITLTDVVVGDVWICSGQSNMQMGATITPELKSLYENSTGVRSFTVRRTVAFSEQDECEGSWVDGPPNSAVAFSFAHYLQQEIDIPVGIILSAWGSSSLEAWMPRDMTETLPHLKTILGEFDADAAKNKQIRAILDKGEWSREEDILLRRQSVLPYNAMMHPLIPFACRGVVWYQGERNSRFISGMPDSPAYMRVAGIQEYDEALIAWINRYRTAWNRDDLQFLLVMLPGYGRLLDSSPGGDQESPDAHSWAWMRESQIAALQLPHVSIANTIDLGDATDIHPKDKLPIGHRLALLAERDTLNRDVVAQGPALSRVKTRGDTLVVHFEHARGLRTSDGLAPTAFWIANESEHWHRADARIVGETVELTAPGLATPRYVRYAFAGKPQVNLINAARLPAYPFRTDRFDP